MQDSSQQKPSDEARIVQSYQKPIDEARTKPSYQKACEENRNKPSNQKAEIQENSYGSGAGNEELKTVMAKGKSAQSQRIGGLKKPVSHVTQKSPQAMFEDVMCQIREGRNKSSENESDTPASSHSSAQQDEDRVRGKKVAFAEAELYRLTEESSVESSMDKYDSDSDVTADYIDMSGSHISKTTITLSNSYENLTVEQQKYDVPITATVVDVSPMVHV
jgi:hypothetical protein